jgi:hypothetical protein
VVRGTSVIDVGVGDKQWWWCSRVEGRQWWRRALALRRDKVVQMACEAHMFVFKHCFLLSMGREVPHLRFIYITSV